jgi:hypothetical protein
MEREKISRSLVAASTVRCASRTASAACGWAVVARSGGRSAALPAQSSAPPVIASFLASEERNVEAIRSGWYALLHPCLLSHFVQDAVSLGHPLQYTATHGTPLTEPSSTVYNNITQKMTKKVFAQSYGLMESERRGGWLGHPGSGSWTRPGFCGGGVSIFTSRGAYITPESAVTALYTIPQPGSSVHNFAALESTGWSSLPRRLTRRGPHRRAAGGGPASAPRRTGAPPRAPPESPSRAASHRSACTGRTARTAGAADTITQRGQATVMW